MPRKCVVTGCNNSESRISEGITFHVFPQANHLKDAWLHQIKIGNNQAIVNVRGVVWSAHFESSVLIKSNKKTKLKCSAYPQNFPNSDCIQCEVLWTEENDKENIPLVEVRQQSYGGKRRLSFDEPVAKKRCTDAIMKNNRAVKSVYTQTEDLIHKPSDSVGNSISTNGILIFADDTKAERKGSLNTRTIRYPGDIDVTVDMSPETARKNVSMCQSKIKRQANEIYRLKQTTKRLRLRISSLKEMMRDLKKKFGLSSHATQSIESTFEDDIINQLKQGRKTKSYNDNVKCFALTLNFYSNAAYIYIRRVFGNHLPCQSTLYNWYKTVNGEPGVSAERLAILKSMSDDMKKENKTLFVTLVHNEMSIRKQLIWSVYKKKYIGYVDFGHGKEVDDSTEEASDALVFMVVPINASGKVPVAYYFTNSFTGEEKAEVIKTLIPLIHEAGAEVLACVFDGASSNITMATCLGANIDRENPIFKNPVTGKAVHIFLDVCHMLKLIRNNFAAKGILYDGAGNPIKWEYIVKLEQLQRTEGLTLATKLTKQHIHFYNNKMKVRLAAL